MPNGYCLVAEQVTKFKQALKDGTLNPEKLANIASEDRRAVLEKIVGTENATQVNALFESKLLLKNQKAGYISWAKKVAGMSPQAKRDIISKIERMDAILNPADEKAFLQDLASTRLGTSVTSEEARHIFDLSQTVKDTKLKMKTDFTFPTKNDKLEHGFALVRLENYLNELKLSNRNVGKNFGSYLIDIPKAVPGILKSFVASLDDSYFGRQGIKTLLDVRTSHIWIKDFLKSFNDIRKQVFAKGKWYTAGDNAALDAIKADIYSSPNALNGKYAAGNYGLNVLTEEAFPSPAPEKIPVLGRLFKASEAAYNGGALRMRKDLADRLIKIAEKQGVNTLDRTQAQGLGTLVSSLTGRGGFEKSNGATNVLLFSKKFLQANFNTLTAHTLDKAATNFAKKEAATNLLSIVTSIAAVSTLAKAINPSSVDLDPRAGHAGQIKMFGRWIDISGGMGSLVSLASRLVPTVHNGQLGFWTKTKSGVYRNLTSGEYGAQTALDIFESFWEGKLSPIAGIVRDVWKGETYSGTKLDINKPLDLLKTEIGNQFPLSIQTFNQLKDEASANPLAIMILEGIGFSSSSSQQRPKDWSQAPTKEQAAFKDKVGSAKFAEANSAFNTQFNDWFSQISQTETYKKLSDSDKQALITKKKENLQANIFKQYGFNYVKSKSTPKTAKEKQVIKELSK